MHKIPEKRIVSVNSVQSFVTHDDLVM